MKMVPLPVGAWPKCRKQRRGCRANQSEKEFDRPATRSRATVQFSVAGAIRRTIHFTGVHVQFCLFIDQREDRRVRYVERVSQHSCNPEAFDVVVL